MNHTILAGQYCDLTLVRARSCQSSSQSIVAVDSRIVYTFTVGAEISVRPYKANRFRQRPISGRSRYEKVVDL